MFQWPACANSPNPRWREIHRPDKAVNQENWRLLPLKVMAGALTLELELVWFVPQTITL
jgi:hypothetical protein